MKIIMLTNAVAPDKLGGLERYVGELATRLAAAGRSVAVVAKRTAPAAAPVERTPEGVTVVRYTAPSKGNPLFALLYPVAVLWSVHRSVRRITREGSGAADDVVFHAHFPIPAAYLTVRRLPYVYTFHAPVHQEILAERQGTYWLPRWAQSLAVRCFAALESWVLRSATRVVTLSRFVQAEALALGVDPARLVLIPGGIDTDRFRPGRPAPVDAAAPQLFAARRLVARTGVEELVRAMALVRQELPGARLAISGSGSRRDQVAALVEELGLGDSVRLLGRVSDEELVDWYRRADIAVTPTQELEGFGLSTAEALSCGTAVVVTPVGANAEVVDGLGPRTVSADRSPRAIADAVVALWADTAERERVRSAARTHVVERFDWDVVASRYRDVYADAR